MSDYVGVVVDELELAILGAIDNGLVGRVDALMVRAFSFCDGVYKGCDDQGVRLSALDGMLRLYDAYSVYLSDVGLRRVNFFASNYFVVD